MVARYVPPSHPHDDLDLEISNNGQSVAKNVRIAFDPPLPEPNLKMLNENALSSSYMASTLELARAVFVGRRFKTIPPGQSIKAPLWSQNRNFRASNIDAISAEGLPSKQGITISYYDDAGTSYIDTFEIDPLIYAGNLFKDSELTKVRKALESHLKNRH
ncbi:hypothetical protein [Corynebacterium sputi]|uniref:hypothetical protein n=1 Tax=Corynebacterium sputi TaxID=489915 RepID=UPI0012EB158E|nr:hypothetical protein [Corynebacterium sputi]